MDSADVNMPDRRRCSVFFCSSRKGVYLYTTTPPHLNSLATMKISAALALAAVGGASAYSVNRSTLRSLGQKRVAGNAARSHVRPNDIKMEGERTQNVLLNSFLSMVHVFNKYVSLV